LPRVGRRARAVARVRPFLPGARMYDARTATRLHGRGGAAARRRRLDRGRAGRDRPPRRTAARAGVDFLGALVGRRPRRPRSDCPAARARGAALLIDATHSAGVLALDVRALDPDLLVFPTYKWVLGPYGRAFLYIAKRRQNGV